MIVVAEADQAFQMASGTLSGVSHRRTSRTSLATCDSVPQMSRNDGPGPYTHRYPSPADDALDVTL